MKKFAIVLILISMLLSLATATASAQTSNPPASSDIVRIHIVQPGETVDGIATQYGLTAAAITHANGIADPREIYVGQRLIIPGPGLSTDMEQTQPYIIQPGDTLTSIAAQYSTTRQALIHGNNLLSPNAIYAGQIINVPAGAGNTHQGAPYIVRAEDTLFRIALLHEISPWALMNSGRIANPALLHTGQEIMIANEPTNTLPPPFVAVETQPVPISQGSAMIITVHTSEAVTLQGRLFDQPIYFSEEDGAYYGLCGVHVFTEPGLYQLELTATDGANQSTVVTTGIIVQSGSFGYERIDLPETRLSILDPAITAAEHELLELYRYTYSPIRQWSTPLLRPAPGSISSYFGTHRAYENGPYTSYHSGVDFRSPTGTAVTAPAAGTVIFTGDLTVRGNTIIIDHGWGLVTGYWHLSSIDVSEGQTVAPGDLIGRVGNTGLSTGAHLHWETWVNGISVNGLDWLEESQPWPTPDVAIGG